MASLGLKVKLQVNYFRTMIYNRYSQIYLKTVKCVKKLKNYVEREKGVIKQGLCIVVFYRAAYSHLFAPQETGLPSAFSYKEAKL